MKLHPFDAKALLRSLRRLDKARRTAFAAAIATRLLCAYEFVAADASLSNGQLPRDTVSALWSALEVDTDDGVWRARLAEVTRLFPQDGEVEWSSVSPDQGWVLYAMADDGIAALMYAIECWLTDDPQQAVWAAQRADEASDQAAIALLNIEPLKQHEKRIQSHAVVQRELARQAADLDWLARRGSLLGLRQSALREPMLTEAELKACASLSFAERA